MSSTNWKKLWLRGFFKSLAFSHSKNLMPFLEHLRKHENIERLSHSLPAKVAVGRGILAMACKRMLKAWYLGSRSAKEAAMAPGRQSNSILAMKKSFQKVKRAYKSLIRRFSVSWLQDVGDVIHRKAPLFTAVGLHLSPKRRRKD